MEPTPGLPSGPQPQLKEDIATVSTVTYTIDSFGTIIFFVVLAQIILLIGLNLYQQSRIKSNNQTLTDKQSILITPAYKTLNTEVDQVISGNSLLNTALASKIDWAKFYNELNAVTPKNVQLTTLSVTDTGQFKADGKTTSLDSLAKALVAWQQGSSPTPTPFSTVVLASNSYTSSIAGGRTVTFSITGQINTGALHD